MTPAVASRTYEPPTMEPGAAIVPSQEPELAPGVLGFAVESRGYIVIPLIIAEHEGSGDVGRFLDSLSPRCVVSGVMSHRLAGMLARRGWIRRRGDLWQRPGRTHAEGSSE